MSRLQLWQQPYYPHRGWQLPLYQPHIQPPGYHPCYMRNILQSITTLLDTVMTVQYRSYFTTLTINFPEWAPVDRSNNKFCSTMEQFLRRIQIVHPQYIWVRERDQSIHQHYHLGLVIDDQQTSSYIYLGQELQHLWNAQFSIYQENSGLVDYVRADQMKMSFLNSDIFNYAVYSHIVYRFSYIAKWYSKESDLDPYTNRWMKSRLPMISC